MQWNPDIATQLIVASDEDNSPSLKVRNTYVLTLAIGSLAHYYIIVFLKGCLNLCLLVIAACHFQMWDVRNIMSPVKEFVGHTKGKLSEDHF